MAGNKLQGRPVKSKTASQEKGQLYLDFTFHALGLNHQIHIGVSPYFSQNPRFALTEAYIFNIGKNTYQGGE